jgi:hydroxysqualene dehydroxylase
MTQAEHEYDVAIIGGGFAGLSAAAALADHGKRVIVLEARAALGGRAASFTDPATGERVDNGQHLLIGGYHETFRFLRRIGSETAVRLQPRLVVDFVDRQGTRSRLKSFALPAPLHLVAGLAAWSALDWRDRLAALRMRAALKGRADGSGPGGPTATVHQWLVQHGQTSRLIELLWEPLAVATLNESIDRAAPGPFRQVLARMFGTNAQDSALGLPLKPLEAMYAVPAQAFVEARHGAVSVNTPARVVIDAGVGVSVGTGLGRSDRRIRSRSVICAVPWFALPDVLPPVAPLLDTIEAARNTPESPIVTVNLWLDRQVMDGEFLGLPGRTMQWVFDKRALFGDNSSHLSLTSSAASGLVAKSNAEIVDIAVTELRAALPRMSGADVRRAVAVREKRATFSVAAGLPARPGTRTGVTGLFLAGDWIDTGLPATIESAVISGHAAARAAAEFLDT